MNPTQTSLCKRTLMRAILLPFLVAAFGCDAMNHGGKSAQEVFPDPKVAALVKAADAGDTAKMEALAHQGADVNYTGQDGQTPLVWVMAADNKPVIAKLLELGADPNRKISNGNSPTWLAAGRDDPQMLELLLQHHGDANIIGAHDTTALEIAVRQFLTKNIDLLVKYGADLNYADAPDATGNSAATWAAALGHFDLVAHLLDLGYSSNLQHLAAMIQASHVPQDSEEQRSKDKVIGMLKARGVQYPVQPAKR